MNLFQNKRSLKVTDNELIEVGGDVERAEAEVGAAAGEYHNDEETNPVDNTTIVDEQHHRKQDSLECGRSVGTHAPDSEPKKEVPVDDLEQQQATTPLLSFASKLATTTRTWLTPVWADRRIGLAITCAVAALWGVLAGLWTPRGPLTTGQAMGSIFISLILVGGSCGLVTRSLRTLLVIPLTFQIFLEAVRLRVDGPTVDKPRFTMYGTLAFITGRGVHILLSVIPIIVGSMFGVTAAHYISKREPRRKRWVRYTGYTVMGLCAIGLLALIIALAIPARTDSIQGTDSISELTYIHVSGRDLALMIRASSIHNPVLLFLAGGPGGSELGAMRNHLQELEDYFVVVTWDQRGCGKSYVELDPIDDTLSPEGYIDYTLQVTDYLRDRFVKDRIYLLGQSWGSLLGVLAIHKSPERYLAYIGTGQMVDALATDTIMYNDTLAWARATGRNGIVNDLISNGPPPYESSVYPYEYIASYEHDVYPYDHTVNSEGEGGFSENLNVKEYNLIQRLHLFGAFLDTYAALYPQIQDIDFRKNGDSTFTSTPVFFVQGAHEIRARSEIFDEWYSTIIAPTKDLVVLNTSGHRPLFEQPHGFVKYMVNTVLVLTT